MKAFNFDTIPEKTGIYLFKDGSGRVLYVGKAKNLKARLRSYLRPESDSRQRIVYMMEEAEDYEFFVTSNEREALLLENNLIKKKRPPYNVYFRDDKEYLCLRIDLNDSFPRFRLVRKVEKDGATYFGPYSSAKRIRSLLALAGKLFPMRSCTDSAFRKRKRPCMQYQIKRCPGPCVGLIGREEYMGIVAKAVKFLKGDYASIRKELRSRMKGYSRRLEYEQAALVRDMLRLIEDLSARQSVVLGAVPDSDIFSLYREGTEGAVAIMFLRNLRVIDMRCFMIHSGSVEGPELLASIISEYYMEGAYHPDEVVVPQRIYGKGGVREIIKSPEGKLKIVFPRRGKRRDMVLLAERNAREFFLERKKKELIYEDLMARMVQTFNLQNRPMRIECFDVSHHGGKHPVGSMAVLYGGAPLKEGYRKFRIKEVEGIDDYLMMGEILRRRMEHAEELGERADLIVIDGGKGHLLAAKRVLEQMMLTVDIIAIAKERKGQGERMDDKIYLPGRKNPLNLKPEDPLLLLIKRVRDEAHRFALAYQRGSERREKLSSLLLSFPGIGPARVQKLLSSYGSMKEIMERPPREISDLLKIPLKRSSEFQQYLIREFNRTKRYGIVRTKDK